MLCRVQVSHQTRRLVQPKLLSTSAVFSPRTVQDLDICAEDFRSASLKQELVPFRLHQSNKQHSSSRARDLVSALRNEEDRIVEVEVGNYDEGQFTTVCMRLGQYLHWLEDTIGGNGKVSGTQVYLAQWRADQQVSRFRVVASRC
jgi:hypothetical protein